MAGIDHTCLYWIDGEPSNYDDVKKALEEYGLYWTRDGVVYSKDKENVVSTATSYDPDSLVYRERYFFFKSCGTSTRPSLSGVPTTVPFAS